MKGYCVDVRGFSLAKKVMVAEAIAKLSDIRPVPYDGLISNCDKIVTIGPARGAIFSIVVCSRGELSPTQTPHQISFDDLMLKAGYNYVEDGVEDFKTKTSNKTRPQITREQYDAVMAQFDKRTFTKALDDLLAIEKEQLLDESAIRIKQLEDKCARINLAIGCQNEQLSVNSYTIDQLRDENERLFAGVTSWRESWERVYNEKKEAKGKLEKHKRISGVLSLLLFFSLVAQLAVIFFQ